MPASYLMEGLRLGLNICSGAFYVVHQRYDARGCKLARTQDGWWGGGEIIDKSLLDERRRGLTVSIVDTPLIWFNWDETV